MSKILPTIGPKTEKLEDIKLETLPGVGPKTKSSLHNLGIKNKNGTKITVNTVTVIIAKKDQVV